MKKFLFGALFLVGVSSAKEPEGMFSYRKSQTQGARIAEFDWTGTLITNKDSYDEETKSVSNEAEVLKAMENSATANFKNENSGNEFLVTLDKGTLNPLLIDPANDEAYDAFLKEVISI